MRNSNPLPQPSSFLDMDARRAAALSLAIGSAASLRPAVAGVLRVVQGRVWLTRDLLPGSTATDLGDHMVCCGEDFALSAGQRVVLESWPEAGASATNVSLVWTPTVHAASATRWQMAVVAPARDLGRALVMALRASARLAAGLAGYTGFGAAGHGKVLARLGSNAP